MENVSIETTQNVVIENNIASVGERILSQLLDLLFILSFYFVVFIIIGVLKVNIQTYTGVILYLPVAFYSLAFEFFFNGQTPGKMILQIKVMKIDGTLATFGSYFVRWIFRLVDVLFTSGVAAILTIIINGRGQRIGDIVAGTTVIRLKARPVLRNTIHVNLPENYRITFNEVHLLSEKDINTINDVRKFLKKTDSEFAEEVARKAKQAVEKKMGVTSTLPAMEFFKTILKDYNYINKM